MIAKNRNGSTGTIKLVFMKEYSKFIQIRALKKAR
ncbi:DnaB-like helicase C-terminal domain-containing protein [Listeria monocytogenes]